VLIEELTLHELQVSVGDLSQPISQLTLVECEIVLSNETHIDHVIRVVGVLGESLPIERDRITYASKSAMKPLLFK
jgi:hypothetical protein